MTFPTEWKINPNVPNHQSDIHGNSMEDGRSMGYDWDIMEY